MGPKFDDIIEKWRKGCRDETSDGWKITQDQMLRDYILPFLGSKKVNRIFPEDIQDVLNRMKELGRSSQLRLHVYNLLNRVFKDLIAVYRIKVENPVLRQFRPKLHVKEPIFLVPEHGFIFLANISGHKYELAFFLNLLCALRVGEIQALGWSNISFENAEAFIRAQYCRKTKKIKPRTKNGEELRVPIPALALERLEKYRKESGFVATKDGKMLCHWKFDKEIKAICKRLKIPVVSSHGLRHSCSEIWYESGAEKEDLRRLLNHKSDKSTYRYIHRSDGRLKDIASRITLLNKKAS